MSVRVGIGLFAISAAAALAWLTFAGSRRDASSDPVASLHEVASAPTSSTAATSDADARAPNPEAMQSAATQDAHASASAADRRALPTASLVGRVVDVEGTPIAGAVVSWTVLPSVLDPLPLVEWSTLEGSTVWTQSGASGEFSFTTVPEGADVATSVIWTTRVDFLAEPRVLAADPKSWESRVDIVLQRAPGASARVIDARDRPARQAHVRQRCVPPNRGKMDRPLSPEEKARVALFRSSDTSDDGTTPLAKFPGEQIVHAELGELASPPWRGELRQPIVLALHPTFTVEGSVSVDGTVEIEGGLRLTISAHLGVDERLLSTHVVTRTAPFGPFAVPLLDGARYSFQLKGGGAVPVTELRDAPAARERLFVELATTMGNDMWFRLLDDREQVLSSGTVSAFWDQGLLRQNAVGTPRDEWPGYILVRGCPNGPVNVQATAPGFAVAHQGPITLPPQEQTGYEIVLERAGRIEGRCLASGKPVRDFEIAVWPTRLPHMTQSQRFSGRDDGSFVIDSAPLGEVTIVAASERDGRSDQVRVHVRPDAPTTSTIELAKTMVGRGRVVDEAGNPVPTATVQLYFNDASTLLAPIGTPWPVKDDGTFELRGLPAGHAQFAVTAPGFSFRNAGVQVEAGKDNDLGRITLLAVQDLEVRLRATSDVDASSYSIQSTSHDGRLAQQSFSRDGHVAYSAVDAGQHHLNLRRPDGTEQVVEVVLYPGRSWIVELDAIGTSAVVVDLDVREEASLPANPRLMLQFTDSAGRPNYRYKSLGEKRQFTYEGVPAGPVFVRVDDGTHKVYGSLTTAVAEGERKLVSLSVGGHPVRFHVVDGNGSDLSAAMVQLYDATGGPFMQSEITDAAGMCEFQGVPDGPLLIGLVHDVVGNVWGTPLERTSDPERAIELQLAPKASVEVQLVDGDIPVQSIACQLQDTVRRLGFTVSTRTDAGGRVRWSKLGPATYSLFTWHRDYWPADAEVVAREDAKTTQVQVRMLGSVEFIVRNSVGAPVVNLPVELRSVEFGADVAEWVSSKRAQASSPSLATDADGKLSVAGVPHGRYTWRVFAGAEPIEGVVVVPRGNTASVPISIP